MGVSQKNLLKLMINNNLIERSLISLKNKNIPNPEIDLRVLLNYAKYSKHEIILSHFTFNQINIDLIPRDIGNYYREILKHVYL